MATKTASKELYPEPNDHPEAMFGHKTIGRYGFAIVGPEGLTAQNIVSLYLPPQSLDENEEAATTLTPMQGGARLRERRGQIGKDITISGTTGFRPAPRTDAPFSTRTGLSITEHARTGYFQFHALRNLFRRYWEIHGTGDAMTREATDLLFYNPADDEMWLVEPMSFRLQRDRTSPLTRRYTIVLKTICAAPRATPPDFVRTKFATTGSWLAGLLASLRAIKDTLVASVQALRAVVTAITGLVRSLVDTLCSLVEAVVGAVTELIDAVISFINLPAEMLTRINSMVDSIFDAAESIGITLPTAAIGALVDIRQNIDAIGAHPDLFVQRWEEQYAEAIANFKAEFRTADEVVNPANLTGVTEATISNGDSLWSLAQKTLGSPVYAHVLALFNKLRPPYIAASAHERQVGLLAPGDTLLIPVFGGGSGSATSTRATRADPAFAGHPTYVEDAGLRLTGAGWRVDRWKGFTLSIVSGAGAGEERLIVSNTADTLVVASRWIRPPTTDSLFRIYLKRFDALPKAGSEESIGRDLRLTETNGLVVTASGDLAAVAGLDNFRQACKIKIDTVQGTLPLHLWFGLAPAFGERGTPDNLFHFRYNALQTFLQDPRVESVEQMNVTLTRDVGEMTARVKVRGGEYQPIKARL